MSTPLASTNSIATPPPTPAPTGGAPVVELFDTDECHRRYPVSDYVQTFEFAQFIDLVASPPAPPEKPKLLLEDNSAVSAVPISYVPTNQELIDSLVHAAENGQSMTEVLNALPINIAAASEKAVCQAFRRLPPIVEIPLEANDSNAARVAEKVACALGLKPVPAVIEMLSQTVQRDGHIALSHPDTHEWCVLRINSAVEKVLNSAEQQLDVGKAYSSETTAVTERQALKIEKKGGPTVVQSNKLQFSAVLPWTQKWKLLGYSRGKLIQSLTLAPQEETTIELFSWDRRRRSLDQTSQTDTESSTEFDQKQQDSMETLRELINGSEFNREVGAQFAASYGTDAQTYVKLDSQGKLSGKDSVTQTARTTGKRISDLTLKASNRVKVQRTSKITESSEVGREERVTRKIRNSNMCRTLSFDYFELMVSYEVQTQPDAQGLILCLLLTNPFADSHSGIYIPEFEAKHLRIYDSILRPALLNDELLPGFMAARLLAARVAAKSIACE